MDGHSAALTAVAADDDENADLVLDEPIDDLVLVLAPAGGSEDGASWEPMSVTLRGVSIWGPWPYSSINPLESVADPVDAGDPVAVVGLERDGTDDVVESGAEAAAGDDGDVGAVGVEVDLAARPGLFDEGDLAAGLDEVAKVALSEFEYEVVVLFDEMGDALRGPGERVKR